MKRAPFFVALCAVIMFAAPLAAAGTKKSNDESLFVEAMGKTFGSSVVRASEAVEDAAALSAKLSKLAVGVNPSVLLNEALEIQADLRETLASMDSSKVSGGGKAAADLSLATLSAGLAGLGQAIQGMRAGSRELTASGLEKVDTALSQMKNLRKTLNGDSEDSAVEEASFGPSLGLDFSWWTSPVNRSMNFGVNASVPLMRTWDLGAALRLGNSNVSSAGVSTDSSYTGFEGFTRIHFPSGRLAPYIGLHGGPTLNTSKSNGSPDTQSTLWMLGPQGGLLFFLTERSAVDLQLRYDRVSSADNNGKQIYAQDQVWLTVGARMMFGGGSAKPAKAKKAKVRRKRVVEPEEE